MTTFVKGDNIQVKMSKLMIHIISSIFCAISAANYLGHTQFPTLKLFVPYVDGVLKDFTILVS